MSGGIGGIGGPRGADGVGAAETQSTQAAGGAPGAAALGKGASGPDVKEVQELLNQSGVRLPRFGADGKFGPETANAVAAFQKMKGMTPTGEVDAATRSALKAAAALGGQVTGIPRERLVSSVDVSLGEDGISGTLTATIGGKRAVLAQDSVIDAKKLGDGRYVVWSNLKGAGGYEGEGQGLALYDAKSGKTKDVMSEYYMVDSFDMRHLPDGKDALLVNMSDGGLGAPHFALVDPERGEVFKLDRAALDSVDGSKLTLAMHEDNDDIERVTSKKTFDLSKLLSGPVIKNEPQ